MNRLMMTISLAFAFYGCSIGQGSRSISIFIPMNYTGWVNIIFRDSNSSYEPLIFENGYVYLITKDPQNFRVKSDIYSAGSYSMNYYYYNTDTIINLSWKDYPKNNILFQRTLGSRDKNHYTPSILAYSFYVSKEALDDSKLSVDMLPKNKILQ